MIKGISGHVHQFSVHQFVIVCELVWKPFKIINSERAGELA